jgi:glycosyltransferase involved in cell wall biosynthesis
VPMLSIIIPTFNSAATIGRCLGSIGNQTFSDFEIVVQDGFSTDNTLEIIRNFQQANSRIEVQTERAKDRGPYDAMNRAVSRARGTWLYFLGSDDELNDENVLKEALKPEHLDNNDVLYGNVRLVGDCWGWAAHDSIYDGPFNLQKLLRANICHQAIFYRADLVRRAASFNVDYAVLADWDFNLRCWALTRFRYIDLVIAKFYGGGISSSKQREEQFQRDIGIQVVRDFGFSLLNPVVNDSAFVGRPGVIEMQKTKGRLYALSGLALRVVLKVRSEMRTGHSARLVRYFWTRLRAALSGLGKNVNETR